MAQPGKPKHGQIYDYVHARIRSGRYGPGQRIPTESELAERFGVSRVTVARALRELEDEGLLQRTRATGTFVRNAATAGQLLGLIAPLTAGAIATVVDEVARLSQQQGYGLLLGRRPHGTDEDLVAYAEELAKRCIESRVVGVFFVPLLLSAEQMSANVRIADAFRDAGIAVVLIDRDVTDYPLRSRLDLVSLDHYLTGHVLAEHLLSLGHREIHFLAASHCASSVSARIAGYRNALARHDIAPLSRWVHRGYVEEPGLLPQLVRNAGLRACIFSTDHLAARAIRDLNAAGLRIPDEVAIVGTNDDHYAALLDVPLTTIRQPCQALAAAAIGLMSHRLSEPDDAPHEVRLSGELVIRESCGGAGRLGGSRRD